MDEREDKAQRYAALVRMVRTAQGLEAGGFYNAAKLFWAAALSEEIAASNRQGGPLEDDELIESMESFEREFAGKGEMDLAQAVRKGRLAVENNATIPFEEIPDVAVCRKCGQVLIGKAGQSCPECGAEPLTLRNILPNYFLEPLPPEQAIQALSRAPEDLAQMLAGMSEAQMGMRPDPGEWSIQEILWHILVSERLLSTRLESMLSEDRPSLSGVAAWASEQPEGITSRTILEEFRESRQKTVARLDSMAAGDWQRDASHEEFGTVTVLQQASYFAKHERDHFWQIRRVRQEIGDIRLADGI